MLRTRRIGASVLAVVTALLLLLSSIGWWANRYLLDSDRFAAKAGQILDQEAVQHALSVAITDQISKASGSDLRIAQPFIGTIVTEVVESGQFETVFDAAVERLHHAITSGDANEAVLNLSDIVDRVRNAIEPIAPSLAEKIPSGEKVRVKILDKTQLDAIYNAVNLVENLVVVMTVLTILCFAAAIALSPRRWRTLALTGWVVLGLFVVQMVAVRLGRGIVGGFPKRAEFSAAATSAYKVIARGLVVQAIVIAVIGLLVALGAGWTDRHGGWTAVRDVFARGTRWVKSARPTPAPAPALATATVAGAAAVGSGTADVGSDAVQADTTEPSTSAAVTTGAGSPEDAPSVGAHAAVEGLLAPRLPQPARRARTAHWWRAAGLVVLGLFAIFSPGSLTTLLVVLAGLVALYLALTEALAAWATPKEPDAEESDATSPEAE